MSQLRAVDGRSAGQFTAPSPFRQSPGFPPTTEADRSKMEAFRKVKPTCVSLMAMVTTPPTSYSPHAGLVDTLSNDLEAIPRSAISLNIIKYILFPITNTLRHHDPLSLPDIYLEATFRLLSKVVSIWKDLEGGMEIGAWEQLWRFATASIAPRVVSDGKGKSKAVGQEVQLQCVILLTTLLEPSDSHPTTEMRDKMATAKSPLIPTLLQTVTLVINTISPTPPHNQLQSSSLRLLRIIVNEYLKGKHSILASVLPGTISSISKMLVSSSKALKGDIAAQSANYIEDILRLTLSDRDLQELGVLRGGLDDLGQLAEEWEESQLPDKTPDTSRTESGKDPFPNLSRSYLDFTSTQLLVTLRPILTLLSSHSSHLARIAAASLSFSLIRHSHQSLPQLIPISLSTLLLLSQDDFDLVRDDATSRLSQLLNDEDTASPLGTALIDLLNEVMNSLPRFILSHQEAKVDQAARLLIAISETTSRVPDNPISDLLGPRGKVERWGWALLDCLEFGRPVGWSASGYTAAKATEKGWSGGMITSNLPLLIEGSDSAAAYSNLPLRYIEAEKTIKAVRSALIALGFAAGDNAIHSVDHFVRLAKANQSKEPSKAASAIWVAQLLLDGVAQGQEASAEGRISKITRKMAKEMTKMMVSMEEEDEDEDMMDDEPMDDQEEESNQLMPVERQKGLDVVTTLLDRPSRPGTNAAKETRRLHQQAQRVILSALSLSTLSITSRILSSSFRPLLLTVLYSLLSQLASPHTLVATYAETTLGHVAYHCGYASVQNLILDNVDYVINVVSQRLTPSRLSSTAPLVLIAMIRMTRSEIVPMVHDIVDEIFDALDDYHGYEVLASGLLAVLVTLVEVMADDVAAQGPSQARLDKLNELNRLSKPPNPERDFARFTDWWKERQSRRSDEVKSILERAPEHAWGKADPTQIPGEEEVPENPPEEAEATATRSEETTTQILDKSLNFLSHRSSFLRAKILSLISRAIPVLASGNREGDLLPLIDRSWGIIMTRLDDPLPYVVTEAAEVIANLCRNVGDFMSKRILDHAWPKLQKILKAQRVIDEKSALARKGVVGTTSAWTVSHRLHLAIVEIATFVAREVPVNDSVLWDMMVVFRPFIDHRAHEELQQKAMQLYKELGVRDGDALWTVLSASTGMSGGVWGYLRDDGLEIASNAQILLEDL